MKVKFNKEVQVSSTKQEVIKRRRWDRWVYLGILLLLLGSFLKWLLFPWIFDNADGLLLKQQYDINFGYDIRVLEYKVKEGQEVKVGDTIFYYEKHDGLSDINNKKESLQININKENNKASLIAIETQILKRRLLIEESKKRLAHWESEREKKKKLVYLNVITPNELANVERWIDDIKHEIAALRTEYNALIWEKNQLESVNAEIENLQFQNSIKENMVFVTPTKGRIDRLRTPSYQVNYKGNIITSIIQSESYVRAYISVRDLDRFKDNDKVLVVLPFKHPDLIGRINKIYSVSELKEGILPEDVRDNQKSRIVMEIIPDKDDEPNWKKLNASNIPVKIRKFRFK